MAEARGDEVLGDHGEAPFPRPHLGTHPGEAAPRPASESAKPSEEDQVVLRDPKDSSTQTYAQIRDLYSTDEMNHMGMTCAEFTFLTSSVADIEYPLRLAAYIKACEEGVKRRNGC